MVAKHFGLYIFARGAPGLLSLATLFAYTRLLSPDEYGYYALAISAATVLGVLFFEWQRLFVARWISKNKSDATEFWNQATVVFSFISIACLAFSGIAAALLGSSLGFALIIACAALAVSTQWSEFAMTFLAAELKPLSYGFIRAARGFIALTFGTLFILVGWGGMGGLIGLICGGFLAVAIIQPAGQKLPKVGFPKQILVREQMSYGLPIVASSLFFLVVHVSDRFFLEVIDSTSAVGTYSAAYDLAQYTVALAVAVVQVSTYPLVFRAFESEGARAAIGQSSTNAELTVAVCLGSAAFLCVLREPIATIALGPSYRETAISLIPWIAVAASLNGLRSTLFDVPFHLAAKTKSLAWTGAIAAGINLLLNWLLIPKFGPLGAALATVAAFAVAIITSYVLAKPLRLLPPLAPAFARGSCVALAGCVGAFLTSLMPISPLLQVLTAALLFASGAISAALLLNSFGAREAFCSLSSLYLQRNKSGNTE